MVIENFEGYFLILCLAVTSYFFVLIFKPYLSIIVLAMVFAVIFYPLYKKLKKLLKDKFDGLASFIMCLFILSLIIIPTILFSLVVKEELVGLYTDIQDNNGFEFLEDNILSLKFSNFEGYVKDKFPVLSEFNFDLQSILMNVVSFLYTTIVEKTSEIIKGTTKMVAAFVFFFMTLFFLFKDGHLLAKKVMRLTPLSNKYDRHLFKRFTEVSMSSIVSTIIVAIVQGFITAIGMIIVGLPAFFAGAAAAFLALLPLFGASLVWFPVSMYLFMINRPWAGIFMLVYGLVIVSLVDNILRPILIKGKTHIHPLLIFFSILGGLSVFGFLGIIFGPLVLALLLTLLHIYEMEYDHLLEKR